MRVVEPHEFRAVKRPKSKNNGRRMFAIVGVLVVVAIALGIYSSNRSSSPALKANSDQKTESKPAVNQAAATPQPTPPPLKTYDYCVGVRGIDEAELAPFAEKADHVLNINRGWSLGNKIAFKKVDTGCDFTLWLASPEYMASFGGVCDSEWSCRIGNSVVANYDKWQNASEAWREANGSLDFYRVMVINHEVGHWFGFGHTDCAGPGQLAPVMQQQSMDLQGCYFNPWPSNEEKAALEKQLNL